MSTQSGRLGVGIIGSGKVGPVIGAALANAGHAIIGISSTTQADRDRIEAILPEAPILDVPVIVERSELVVLAVPESELEALVNGLATVGAWQPGQLVFHTVAGLGTSVLAPAVRAGAIPLALHPALAFTGTSVDLVRLRESYCAVTAPAPVQAIGQALAVELGTEPVLIEEKDRKAYGEAVATASSFSAAIVSQSIELLQGIGVESPGAVIASLVRSTVDNTLNSATVSHLEPTPDGGLDD
ncbi:MAG: DUF2520 domain-containing protein [Cryobacterium sp.]|nr:DUF2520 domain-containing protein [Cryobacterium sp.]